MRFYNTPVKRTKIHECLKSMDIGNKNNTISTNFMGFGTYFNQRSKDLFKPFYLSDFLDSLAGIVAFPVIFAIYPAVILSIGALIVLASMAVLFFIGCCCLFASNDTMDSISRNLAIAVCGAFASIGALGLEIARFVCGTAASIMYLFDSILNYAESKSTKPSKTEDESEEIIEETLGNSKTDDEPAEHIDAETDVIYSTMRHAA